MSDQENFWYRRWIAIGQAIRYHVAIYGLEGVAAAFGDALRPLAPAVQQLLWIVQPLAGVFGQEQPIGALADLLGNVEDDLTADQETLCSP